MSFGWSAGDILAAANFCRIVGKALHDSRGSKSEYQSAAQYIETVAKTLDGLVSTIRSNPDLPWEAGLVEQVNILRTAITAFEDKIAKYEASLNKDSTRKKWQTVPREVQFAFSSVKELQRDISQPQLVLNNFINIQTLSTTLEILKTSKLSLTTLSNVVDGVGTLNSAVRSQLEDIESKQQQSATVLRDSLKGVDTHMSAIVALQHTMREEQKVDIKIQQQWQDKLQTSIQGLVDCNKAQLEALLRNDTAVAGEDSSTSVPGVIGQALMLIGNGVAGAIGGYVALNRYQPTAQSQSGMTNYGNEYRNSGTGNRGDMRNNQLFSKSINTPVLRQDSYPIYGLDSESLANYLESLFPFLKIPIGQNESNDKYMFEIPRALTEGERDQISKLRSQTSFFLSPKNCQTHRRTNNEESDESDTKSRDLILLVKDGENKYWEVHAILDPDCKDNWISPTIVKRLNLQRNVRGCQMVQIHCVSCGELTSNKRARLKWQSKESPQPPRVDEFLIFQEAIDVEAVLGNEIIKRHFRGRNPRFQGDYDDGNEGSSRINRGTARARRSIDSADDGSYSDWPPRSNLNHSTQPMKQIATMVEDSDEDKDEDAGYLSSRSNFSTSASRSTATRKLEERKQDKPEREKRERVELEHENRAQARRQRARELYYD